MTQGSIQSALTCIEESYFVGDVIIASSAVIGSGVILRADPGCSITIRDGVCLGAGVIVHASQGSIEVHQGVCLAGGVLIVGQGRIGKQVCVGSGTTLINPHLPDCAMIGANCLWGDESRSDEEPVCEPQAEVPNQDDAKVPSEEKSSSQPKVNPGTPLDVIDEVIESETSHPETSNTVAFESRTVTSKTVIGKQQFEMMLKKMFPDREAFKRSQTHSQ